ncbi:DUF3843 family protein [Sodaliphilus sp.]|uniref:DUF3843 family protein n=1 Tax=Sodaliphilus sp. TaxID=2815818 RepID=UPI00388D8D4B
MKFKRIFNKEWLSLHPYTNADSVDLYYVNLANRIKKTILGGIKFNPYKTEDSLNELSCMLTAWFEDVISQLGIWQAFTTECEKVYGTRLPFYDVTQEYYPDEINVQDIKFLLWHHLQTLQGYKRIADPFSPHIDGLANELYKVFDEEYETAPENNRMQQYLTQELEEEGRFVGFRNILQWFHTQCYLCLDNKKGLAKDIADNIDHSGSISPASISMAIYSATVSDIFTRHTSLLGMTAPEWMSRIFHSEPLKTFASELKYEGQHDFLIEAEDDTYVHLIQTDKGERRRFKLHKRGIDQHSLPEDVKPGHRCLTSLVFFDGEYVQNGGLFFDDPKPDNDAIVEDANKQEQQPEKKEQANSEPYPDYGFVAATGGKGYTFFGSKGEAIEFFNMNVQGIPEEVLRMVIDSTNSPTLCIYDEKCGLVTLSIAEFLNFPDNPYYKEAPRNINRVIALLCDWNNIPYSVVCKLNRLGMLDSVRHYHFTGTAEELRKHNQFIIDYFYCQHQ